MAGLNDTYGVGALFQKEQNTGGGSSFSTFVSVRVKDIILDDKHPNFEEYGGWNGVGTIFYDNVEIPFANDSINNAIPVYSNHKLYPLINEIVPIVFLTSWDAQSNTSFYQAYYFPTINIWNSQHHNALPDPTKQPSNKSQKDYENAIDGSQRDIRRVNDENTDIDLGEGFNEQINVHPLKFFAGDNILEGRWGNSLRLGSTIKDKINSPITIIKNGQADNISEDSWVPIVESINSDKSLIYLTQDQKIDIEVASKEYTSYTTVPTSPKEYNQNQIILNSGRLLFNSKTSDILLSSNKSINLNSVNSVNIDSKETYISSEKIYLGDKNASEPVLKGDITVTQLSTMIDSLIQFFTIYGKEPSPYKPGSTPQANSIVGTLTGVKSILERSGQGGAKSNRNFTK